MLFDYICEKEGLNSKHLVLNSLYPQYYLLRSLFSLQFPKSVQNQLYVKAPYDSSSQTILRAIDFNVLPFEERNTKMVNKKMKFIGKASCSTQM